MSSSKINSVRVNSVVTSDIREVLTLNGEWALQIDPENRGMAESWASKNLNDTYSVNVPGAVQSVPELAVDYPPLTAPNSYSGTAWMEKTFDLNPKWTGRRVHLKLGGAAPAIHLWLNGTHIDYHAHMPVSAKWDVTDLLDFNGPNRLTVAVVEQDLGMMGGFRRWSGIYRGVELETSCDIRFEDIFWRPDADSRRLSVSGLINNDFSSEVEIVPILSVSPWQETDKLLGEITGEKVTVPAGGNAEFAIDVDLPEVKLWSCDEPNLNVAKLAALKDGELIDEVAERFGMRSIKSENASLRLNGHPLFLAGAGHEYFSPTISPLVDRKIIKKRFQALKDHGFNFMRCHTYVAMNEELEIADEMGVLLTSEVGLVSNFHKTLPYEAAREILAEYIVQTRHHPSVFGYCLGNEGSQLMVKMEEEREHAKEGYEIIKRYAPDHMAMIAFGIQGERPELPNDIESPHFWSHNFKWAYAGMSRIPWRLLESLGEVKPCVAHEFGKFTTWPNPAEDDLMPENGYCWKWGEQAGRALADAGLADKEGDIIRNSRELCKRSFEVTLEQIRRQKGMDGFVIWSFFRKANMNNGLIDDMGEMPDHDPKTFREGCNSPLAVLIDKDFHNRTWSAGDAVVVGAYLSNFSDREVREGVLRWSLTHGTDIILSGELSSIQAPLGENLKVGEIKFSAPELPSASKVELKIELTENGSLRGKNAWPFWVFPKELNDFDKLIVYDIADSSMARQFRTAYPDSVEAKDFDSILRGAKTWEGRDVDECLEKYVPDVVVADHCCEISHAVLARGGSVLRLDSGDLPEAWLADLISYEGGPDANTNYTNFRSGWDQGNIATLLENHPILENFPHDGWCDLQFYNAIQDSRPIRTQAVDCGKLSEPRVIVRNVPKMRAKAPEEAIIQDPQALKNKKRTQSLDIVSDDRAYMLEAKVGSGRILISTLKHFLDPAGKYLLRKTLEYLSRKA